MTKPQNKNVNKKKIGEEDVKEEVRQFSSKIDGLKFLMGATFTLPVLGLGLFGPIGLLLGAAGGLLGSTALKGYSTQRKKSLEEVLGVLRKEGKISSKEATELKSKIDAIYTDALKKKTSST